MKTIRVATEIVNNLERFAKPQRENTLVQLAEAKSIPNYRKSAVKGFSNHQLADTFESGTNYVRSDVREFPSRYGLTEIK